MNATKTSNGNAPVARKHTGHTNEEWAEMAYYVLVDVAAYDQHEITYGELYDRVRARLAEDDRPSLRRTSAFPKFMANRCADVAKRCHDYGEPWLSALVVNASSQKVSDGYIRPLRDLRGENPAFPTMHAQAERTKCYAFFGVPPR